MILGIVLISISIVMFLFISFIKSGEADGTMQDSNNINTEYVPKNEYTEEVQAIPKSLLKKYRADVESLNKYLIDANTIYPQLPVPYKITMYFNPKDDIYNNSHLIYGDRYKAKKYPSTLYFKTRKYEFSIDLKDDIFGQIDYLKNNEIGKASIVVWKKDKCFEFTIKKVNGTHIVNQIYRHTRDGKSILVYKYDKGYL